MSQRFRELAEQAGVTFNSLGASYAYGSLPDVLERFAELIRADEREACVMECLDIVNRKEYSYHESDPLWETAQLIKEHFGIE
jgi:hypothetical protein